MNLKGWLRAFRKSIITDPDRAHEIAEEMRAFAPGDFGQRNLNHEILRQLQSRGIQNFSKWRFHRFLKILSQFGVPAPSDPLPSTGMTIQKLLKTADQCAFKFGTEINYLDWLQGKNCGWPVKQFEKPFPWPVVEAFQGLQTFVLKDGDKVIKIGELTHSEAYQRNLYLSKQGTEQRWKAA